MKTLFVMDPLDRIHVAGDSTYMMMREATDRGFSSWYCTPGDLRAEEGAAQVRCWPVRTTRDAPHFHVGAVEDRPLGDFDVVWMRKDPPFDIDYIFATYLLDLAPAGTLVLNRPASLRDWNEKMATFRFPEFCVPTLVTQDVERAVAWAREAPGKVVVKPWDGNGGRGVLVSHPEDGNLRSMVEIHTQEGRRACILQHYIPAIKDGDKRIILIEGEPVGAMLRVPQPGDHRGNMHVGARVQATELTAREQRICTTLGPALRDHGLLFVGIDVIGDFLTEINVTSPTGIQEINALTGGALEADLTDAVEARLAAHRGATP